MKLSILIPTLPTRVNDFFPSIINSVCGQVKKSQRKDIEVLGLLDNWVKTVGEKRNMLLDLASGEFTVFIDDDDRVSSDYIESIMKAIDSNPNADCIVFNSICTINKGPEILCKYGVELDIIYNKAGRQWQGKPAHTMVYNAKIAKKHKFPAINFHEDTGWVEQAQKEIKKQVRINKVLYYYDHRTRTSDRRRL